MFQYFFGISSLFDKYPSDYQYNYQQSQFVREIQGFFRNSDPTRRFGDISMQKSLVHFDHWSILPRAYPEDEDMDNEVHPRHATFSYRA